MEEGRQLLEASEKFLVILIGEVGNGKSHLIQRLGGRRAVSKRCVLPVTQEVQLHRVETKDIWQSSASDNILLVDTPGLADRDKPPDDILNQVVKLANASKGIGAVVFVQKATEQRVKAFDIIWNSLVTKIFTNKQEALDRIVFGCTHSDQLDDLRRQGDLAKLDNDQDDTCSDMQMQVEKMQYVARITEGSAQDIEQRMFFTAFDKETGRCYGLSKLVCHITKLVTPHVSTGKLGEQYKEIEQKDLIQSVGQGFGISNDPEKLRAKLQDLGWWEVVKLAFTLTVKESIGLLAAGTGKVVDAAYKLAKATIP